ncbi:taste receptor type 1 member 2-like [Synchiropus splendidus]|uniref:taste receptor type 1 member 2-like n=1 Tax=Synchiropus splendidus TaxID=270530 RepID=UPI00237E6381|nr:taste receptor type 1 member 2-like [Synchiropus splendidus]
MKRALAALQLLGYVCHAVSECTLPASEFHLDGDYLIGGIFKIHYVYPAVPPHRRPESLLCSSQLFSPEDYLRFQVMRFSVEQINNSTELLPNVSVGYHIFDHCHNAENFPNVLDLISVNGSIKPWEEVNGNGSVPPEVIAVSGPFTSTDTLTTAPLFMMDLFPLISYGAASSVLSGKAKYPSFMRTVFSNKEIITVIVNIIQHFKWRWVAFLRSDESFGNNGLDLFVSAIQGTQICLAYSKGLRSDSNYTQIFQHIEHQKINVIIVFAPQLAAEDLVGWAVKHKVSNKVWLAGDTWALSKKLRAMEGIDQIGTVIGISQNEKTIPGFSDFIHATRGRSYGPRQQKSCNQVCNCSSLTPEQILASDHSFTFSVYSSVYAIAHALHRLLNCSGGCHRNATVYPYTVLAALKKSNFTLLKDRIKFDPNGDPLFGSYLLVHWNKSLDPDPIGYYNLEKRVRFYINDSKIEWFTNAGVPTSLCSEECLSGYMMKQDGIHKCCFTCEMCPEGTYVDITEDPYQCSACNQTQWSAAGSISCNQRRLEFVPFSDRWAILILFGAAVLVALILAVSAVFAVNYNTPVVRSSGGPMCFLILACLFLSSLSVSFYFGEPATSSCSLRFLPFVLFYTVCLSCFAVRSFQIVCIFKMASKFPNLQSYWGKYHAQWLLIAITGATQFFVIVVGFVLDPSTPEADTSWSQQEIILKCVLNFKGCVAPAMLLSSLCALCFVFSYMGKDLPKNYNEAQAITFCLMLLTLTWVTFITIFLLYQGKHLQTLNALAVLSSLYSFLLWYFLPKCYIILFQPEKNTPQYFQGLIQNYTKTISQ